MMIGKYSFVSEIMAQSLERTVELLNAIQSGSAAGAAEWMMPSAIRTAGLLGMTALIMVCSVIGTVVLLKLVKRFFENPSDGQW